MSSDVIGLPGLAVAMAKRRTKVKDLARKLNVTPEHLSGVKNGSRPASLPLARQAAQELGCTVDFLLTDPAAEVAADA